MCAKSSRRRTTSSGPALFVVASIDPEATISERHGRPIGRRKRAIATQRLEPPNTRLITAGVVTINDMEMLRACVAYENANQQRVQILRRLDDRASEIRSEDD